MEYQREKKKKNYLDGRKLCDCCFKGFRFGIIIRLEKTNTKIFNMCVFSQKCTWSTRGCNNLVRVFVEKEREGVRHGTRGKKRRYNTIRNVP